MSRSGTAGAPTPGQKGKQWAMRLLAMLLIPALFLGAVELGLRLLGYGYPTGFFLKKTIAGKMYYETNYKFAYRFFPRALARTPIPQRFAATKAPGTFRVFIFGESAANGDPDPAYGFGRHLEILLRERYPGTRFEVICTAITAINSHAIRPIARQCAQLEGDLWILYMGNNEMIGPFGASTVFGSQAPQQWLARATLALRTTRTGQLLNAFVAAAGSSDELPASRGGIGMFSENLLRPDDPGRLRVYANFRANLEAILEAGNGADIPVLVGTVASNLVHCSPFASLSQENLGTASSDEWEGLFEEGKKLEEDGAFADALARYDAAAAIDPQFAELHFRRGLILARLGKLDAARAAFVQARDLDALVVRADSRINAILRETTAAFDDPRIHLVDTVERLADLSPGGLPGRNLFFEHVHFTPTGNYILAGLFADALIEFLPADMRATDTGAWPGASLCQERLALTLWDQIRLLKEMEERLSEPPFTAQLSNPNNLGYLQHIAASIGPRRDPAIDRRVYEEALARSPNDPLLRAHFGHYLQENGSLPEALVELEWVSTHFPDFEGAHQNLGIALLLAGQYEEAARSFERVLALRPGYPKGEQALELSKEMKAREDD
jgi:Flp pilus assembly protein TadD